MSNSVYNPYHFIPIQKLEDGEAPLGSVKRKDLESAKALRQLDHSKYQDGCLSGRITVLATTHSPVLCGNETCAKNSRWAKVIQPYDIDGTASLPASALRGVLSSLHESATQSALRILTPKGTVSIDETTPFRYNQRKKNQSKPVNIAEYFAKIGPEYLPLNQHREYLTLTEQIWGVVEQFAEKSPGERQGFALKSRVRISDAIYQKHTESDNGFVQTNEYADKDVIQKAKKLNSSELCAIPFKQLSSPKLYPPFYFKKKQEDKSPKFISKKELTERPDKSSDILPQGRKFYLKRQHSEKNFRNEVFVDESLLTDEQDENKLRNKLHKQYRCSEWIVPSKSQFIFTIDFDNLTKFELGSICYVLQPNETYQHQIGTGKPLGMGQIKLFPIAIETINREKRYRDGPNEKKRYHDCWYSQDTHHKEVLLKLEKVPADAESATNAGDLKANRLREQFCQQMAGFSSHFENVFKIIELSGRAVDQSDAKITYPGNYEWYNKNDEAAGQFLRPLDSKENTVPSELPRLYNYLQSSPPPLKYQLNAKQHPPQIHPQKGENYKCKVIGYTKKSKKPRVQWQIGNITFSGILVQSGSSQIETRQKYPKTWSGILQLTGGTPQNYELIDPN